MWASVTEYLHACADARTEAERFIDLGERVLVLDRHTARGRRSGIAVEHEVANLFTVRGGRIVRWEAYWAPPRCLPGSRNRFAALARGHPRSSPRSASARSRS